MHAAPSPLQNLHQGVLRDAELYRIKLQQLREQQGTETDR